MSLVLGVKAHYSQISTALELCKSIELHEDLAAVNGEGFSKQLEALRVFDKDPINSLSIHCPFKTSSRYFDLFRDGEDAEITEKTLLLGDKLAEYCSPVVFVFHALGEQIADYDEAKRMKEIENLAHRMNGMANAHRLVTVENGSSKFGIKHFARLEDFEVLVGASKKNVGMTIDICHLFMEYEHSGYDILNELTSTYGDRIFNIHISDLRFSEPLKSEGTQIGEGDLDFDRIFDSLSDLRNDININVIPEIHDGHLNDYAGFRIAVERLKHYF
jgi:sugar phosphate isomerase/epimerase